MDLSEFLAAHSPDTDLRLVEWHSDGAERVRCVLETSPWWVAPAHRGTADGRLVIDCAGVLEAELRVGQRQREVEDLEVLADHPLLWRYGPHASVYGDAPLPDPAGFFAALVDLADRFGTGIGASAYLGASFADWRERVTGSTPYLLLAAPEPLVDACLPLLDEQGARYTVVRNARPNREPAPRLVAIGESWIICRQATFEVEPAIATQQVGSVAAGRLPGE